MGDDIRIRIQKALITGDNRLKQGVDPAKVLYLGKDANEQQVKSAELSRFRIVAFSTHGLLPGDLNGLTQPALALTAPEVAGIDGDDLRSQIHPRKETSHVVLVPIPQPPVNHVR